MTRWILTSLLCLVAAPALGQTVTIHTQDFEGRGPAWQAHGLWATDESPQAAPGGSAYSGTKSLNFNDGRSYAGMSRGAAASPRLTAPDVGELIVAFRCNYETETTGARYDQRSVVVRIDSAVVQTTQVFGRATDAAARCAAMGTWHRHELRVPGPNRPGATVDVEFVFDSVDAVANDYAGWFVDDFELLQVVTPAAAFTRVDYSTLNFRDLATQVEVLGDRSVAVRRSSPTARYAPLAGRATDAEWQALTGAVQTGALGTVPATIPDTNVYIVRPTTFTLNVDSAVSANQASISGSVGVYDQWAPQVAPVVAALQAIHDRLIAGATSGDDHGDDAASATPVKLDGSQQPVAGAIDPAGDVDWFKVQDTRPFIMIYPPPQLVYVFETAVSGGMDTVIELYASDGTTLLGTDDDGGQGLASRITFTSNAGSSFYVKVRHYGAQGTGSYTLTVGSGGTAPAPPPPVVATLEVGGPAVNGTIGTPGEVDTFQLTQNVIAIFPPPTFTYTIEAQVIGGMDTVIELYAADGTLLATNDDAAGLGYGSRITYTAQAGTLGLVKVRHYSSNGTGDYTISATAGPAAP